MRSDLPLDRTAPSTGLVDVLDRVLDKGLLIAGDIRVSLAEVELLTIRIRLIVCSIDKAQEIGLDWWSTTSTSPAAQARAIGGGEPGAEASDASAGAADRGAVGGAGTSARPGDSERARRATSR